MPKQKKTPPSRKPLWECVPDDWTPTLGEIHFVIDRADWLRMLELANGIVRRMTRHDAPAAVTIHDAARNRVILDINRTVKAHIEHADQHGQPQYVDKLGQLASLITSLSHFRDGTLVNTLSGQLEKAQERRNRGLTDDGAKIDAELASLEQQGYDWPTRRKKCNQKFGLNKSVDYYKGRLKQHKKRLRKHVNGAV